MNQIGQWLREAREEQGLTIADVQCITKIRSRYLTAIEEGNFAVLPGEAYARVFIRTYANAINIDPRPLLSRYDDLYNRAHRRDTVVEQPPSTPIRMARFFLATLNGTMEWLGL